MFFLFSSKEIKDQIGRIRNISNVSIHGERKKGNIEGEKAL